MGTNRREIISPWTFIHISSFLKTKLSHFLNNSGTMQICGESTMNISHCDPLVVHDRMLPVGIMEKGKMMAVCPSFAELPCFMGGSCVVMTVYCSPQHS